MVDTLVHAYLSRLEAAAARLPADRREELLDEIREHIDGARAAGAAADEAAVRTLLDRLGQPEEIVAAAVDEAPHAAAPSYEGVYAATTQGAVLVASSTMLETAACLMLTVGSLLPVVGWLVGVALLWGSRRWSTGQKVLATLVTPGGPGLLLYLAAVVVAGGRTCTETVSTTGTTVTLVKPGQPNGFPLDAPPLSTPAATATESCSGGLPLPAWATLLLLLAGLLAPVVVAVVLHRKAKARAALEPPRPQGAQPGGATWGGLEVAAVLLIGLGSFLVPVVGTVTGLVCLLLSTQWTAREKTIATLLAAVPALIGLLLFLSLFASFSG